MDCSGGLWAPEALRAGTGGGRGSGDRRASAGLWRGAAALAPTAHDQADVAAAPRTCLRMFQNTVKAPEAAPASSSPPE